MTEGSTPLKDGQHERFAQELAFGGCSKAEAHKRAGYKNGDANAAKVARKYGIPERVEYLKKQTETSNVLTAQEKREFLALAVRTPIGEIDENHVLCQSLKRKRLNLDQSSNRTPDSEDDDDGYLPVVQWIVEEIKAVDKLNAIKIDNEMAGDNKPQEIKHSGEVGVSIPEALKSLMHGPGRNPA